MKEASLPDTLKACLFFLTHIVFRTTALAFCAAYMGYYFLVPVFFAILVGVCILIPLYRKEVEEGDSSLAEVTLPVSLALTLLAPISVASNFSSHRKLMKRTLTLTNILLILSLAFIRIVPEVVAHHDQLTSTYGLCHLNFFQPTGDPVKHT